MCEDRLVSPLVNDIDGKSVARLHQSVEILSAGMDLNPARVVTGIRSLEAVNQSQFARRCVLEMGPDLVGL